ncbi:MAG: DM13 domain-containing protein [Gammaproteobacteria bacterium]|nr:DM13 domain-containing protein [Gammaproteobacteria bacterium]MBT8436941.1 DM13 domain-containing protein [Gammaproteobacteria bacterium]
MFKFIRFLITHGIALALGFALGIYLLPILVAPPGPSDAEVSTSMSQAMFTARFRKDLPGSDFLHWGEGTISISAKQIGFKGSLAPGPDYRLYLTRKLVLDEQEFLEVKNDSVVVGEVKTFSNFILPMPESINPSEYTAVVVWCESFGEFITAANYQ